MNNSKTDAEIFGRFSPFIREFIYRNGWENLRQVQLEAARCVFTTDSNLLLTSATASGKTEAAFFPVLTLLEEDPPSSVGVLYISPLKALINDQYGRLDELTDGVGIPVTHWHGDVAGSHKKRLLEDPRGVLQITPESLESMLINRSNDIVRIFGDLRFVIIDEIHTLTGSDRGNQIICQLERIGHLIGRHPRRIGLSATVGEPQIAAAWLSAGSGRKTDIPVFPESRLKWRLGIEHFYIQNQRFDQTETDSSSSTPETSDEGAAKLDAGYEFIYDCSRGRKALVFSNSREETEYVTATLRQIAKERGEEDVFLIHHGNLSAAIREDAEARMKDDSETSVACATVTMELGIDIGRLERIIHNGSPNSVMSFLQRLGRSGRRGQPPEMMIVVREEEPLPNTPLPQLIPWDLIRSIAVIQLYVEERFIEPPAGRKLPYSLAFHQILSVSASSGELKPAELAAKIHSLPPLSRIPGEDMRELFTSMLDNRFLETTEEGGLITGMAGERLLSSFKFYAVFKDTDDFTVRCDSDEIGTISAPPPVGDRFALAGRVWEVTELDISRRLIYVRRVEGKMEISWPGDYGEIHTKILKMMRRVLEEDTVYPYLKPNAVRRLDAARKLAANTGMLERSIVCLGGSSYCMFPWLGTRSFRTIRKYLAKVAPRFGISGIGYEGCCYITFKMEKCDAQGLAVGLAHTVYREGIDTSSLVGANENPVFEKYDPYIPSELLRRAYYTDKLNADEVIERVAEMAAEFVPKN